MKQFLTILLVSVYTILLGLSIGKLPWTVIFFIAVLPFIFLRLASKTIFLILPIITFNSGLRIPGVNVNFEIYQFFCFIYVSHYLLTNCIEKKKFHYPDKIEYICLLFMIVWIILLMSFRGVGMRIFGSEEMGGAVYFQILFCLIYYLFSRTKKLSQKNIIITVLLFGLSGVLPLLANAIFVFSKGLVYHQLYFFTASGAIIETTFFYAAGAEYRLAFLSYGVSLIWIYIYLQHFNAKNLILQSLLLLSILACTFFSGYRSVALSMMAFLLLYFYTLSKRKYIFYAVFFTFLSISYLLLMLFALQLPFSIQRTISNLPGIEVSIGASEHAQYTMQWRYDLWSFAIQDLDKYWYFGRGLTYDPSSFDLMEMHYNDPHIYYINGIFHQATLELAILYGIPMLLAVILFFTRIFYVNMKQLIQNSAPVSFNEKILAGLLLFTFVKAVLAFSGGISQDLLTELPIYLAFFNIIKNSNQKSPYDEDRRYTS